MASLLLPCPRPFRFRDIVFSHGWLYLPPFRWDEGSATLHRIERLPDGGLVELRLREAAGGVLLDAEANPEDLAELARRARWMLALDEDFSVFHVLCAQEAGLADAALHGQGRILRCPTVWEDVVKTLFSVNTTWRQTVNMTLNLVTHHGQPYEGSPGAFPTPSVIAAAHAEELQRVCRLGYRAASLVAIARAVDSGTTDLEALKDPAVSVEEVEDRLRALPGIGPYAAANVLMLLGRYDHLPVDSWFRQTIRDGWFEGRDVPEREMVAAFERFRPFRTLVYRFYKWPDPTISSSS